jgi:hypothetical protein
VLTASSFLGRFVGTTLATVVFVGHAQTRPPAGLRQRPVPASDRCAHDQPHLVAAVVRPDEAETPVGGSLQEEVCSPVQVSVPRGPIANVVSVAIHLARRFASSRSWSRRGGAPRPFGGDSPGRHRSVRVRGLSVTAHPANPSLLAAEGVCRAGPQTGLAGWPTPDRGFKGPVTRAPQARRGRRDPIPGQVRSGEPASSRSLTGPVFSGWMPWTFA